MKYQQYLPILVSILVIILVAFLQRHSRSLAAISATMPINIPLSLWIVYALSEGDRTTIDQYTSGMVIGIVPTVGFLIAVWFASRMGLKLVPIILSGYTTWMLVLLGMMALRNMLGFI
jgi:hypothetical protein